MNEKWRMERAPRKAAGHLLRGECMSRRWEALVVEVDPEGWKEMIRLCDELSFYICFLDRRDFPVSLPATGTELEVCVKHPVRLLSVVLMMSRASIF